MRRLFLLSALCTALALATAGCGSRTAPKTASEGAAFNGKVIVLTDSLLAAGGADTLRFGRLHEGMIAQRRLRFENRTARPVVLLRHEANCGCVSLQYEPRPFAPGETCDVTLQFDARGEWGWQMKLLRLHLSGAAAPLKLFVEADIE